jgi:hypothetical protein
MMSYETCHRKEGEHGKLRRRTYGKTETDGEAWLEDMCMSQEGKNIYSYIF